jgi:hypothetical protein
MTWTITKDALFHVLDILDLVPTRPGITASEFIKAERGKDGVVNFHIASEISGCVPLKGTGEWPVKVWYLDRRLFAPFIIAGRGLSKKEFEFSTKDDQLIVRHGARRATFEKAPEVPGYSDAPSSVGGAITLSPESLQLIACAREFASGDPTTPELNCVFIQPSTSKGDLRIYAATKRVIYYARSGEKVKLPHALPMPPFIVSLLTNEHLKKIYWTKKEIVLEFDVGRVWQTTSIKAGNFPVDAVHGYMKNSENFKEAFSVDSRVFALAICRLGQYLTAVRREDWTLSLRGVKGSDKVHLCSSVSKSSFKETVSVETLKADIDLLWPLNLLLPMFDFLSTKRKEGTLGIKLDDEGRAFVKTKHIQVIIPKKAEKGKKK